MKNYSGFQVVARAGAGLLLLAAALTAWGINITLSDGANDVTCAITGTTTIDANGDINTTVNPGSTCDLSGGGGGDPPPPGSFTLSVGKAGTGSGTVTSSPTGINCGADCSQAYTDGTSVSLSAVPATGSTFTSWSGACAGTGTCNLSMTANRSVTATFTADSVGDCGPLPPDVTIVDTGSINQSWPQETMFPVPQNIAAYKVVVPVGVSATNTFDTARTSAGTRAKLLVVSTCPGILEPVGGQSRCMAASPQETSTVRLATGQSSFRCSLSPGTYYVNAVSKSEIGDTGFTCSNTTNCSYFVSRTRN